MATCGLLNLASCLPQAFFEYFVSLLNAPLQPLLNLNRDFLSAPVSLSIFSSIWAIVIYVISMFYALLIIYSGFQFIVSGYDASKRENAKEWLKNILIMIILVQASFFIYELFVGISASLTSGTINLIEDDFFILTADNLTNIGLQLVFFLAYILTLLLTALMLIVRYCIVGLGVALFPLGIFVYFIQPLRSYGLFFINFLGVAIFITFLDSVILAGFSKLVEISLFANVKILVMIAAFLSIDIMMFLLMFLSIIKSALSVGTKVAAVVAKFA